MQHLIKAVRAHAMKNWHKDGWDYLAECWDDQDIAWAIGDAKNARAAIAACKRQVKILNDHRNENAVGYW